MSPLNLNVKYTRRLEDVYQNTEGIFWPIDNTQQVVHYPISLYTNYYMNQSEKVR